MPLLPALTAWSTDPATLDPTFRTRIEHVVAALAAEGWTPTWGNTWRSPGVQDLLYGIGRSTELRGGQSCHNHVDASGRPAALAADIWAAPMSLDLVVGTPERLAAEAPFLRALGRAAGAEGLRWGGDWHSHASAWDAYALGWDPGHVELPGCI